MKFDAAKSNHNAITAQIKGRTLRRDTVEHFLRDLMNQPSLVTGFDPMVWHTMVEGVTVYGPEDVRFTFKDGTECRV